MGNEMFVSMIFSTIGVGYFIYGKKEAEASWMLAGAILCIYPYMVEGAMAMFIIGAALMAAPFIYRWFFRVAVARVIERFAR